MCLGALATDGDDNANDRSILFQMLFASIHWAKKHESPMEL